MISQKSFAQTLQEGDQFTIGDITYTIRETYNYDLWVSCRAANTSISGEITVPSSFNYNYDGEDYYVFSLILDDNAFANCTGITKIILGAAGVDGVGDNIFKNCTNLKTIDWDCIEPQYTGTIGTGTFDGCTSLDTIFVSSVNICPSCSGSKTVLTCLEDDYPSMLNKVYVDISQTNTPTYIPYGAVLRVNNTDYGSVDLIIKKEPLKVENYTLMGDLGNTGTYEFLNNNEDLNNQTYHNFAMMAVPYDYSNNNWGSWITSASTATP